VGAVKDKTTPIKLDEPKSRVRAEAIQVAAMVFRYLETGDKHE